MSQTPYDSLMKKERERKFQLYNKIQKKDTRYRSVGNNIKLEAVNEDPQTKVKDKQKISFNNSIKKSYLGRKFMNKTVEGHINSQQFNKFREKMAKRNKNDGKEHDMVYRQIWQSKQKNDSKQLSIQGLEKSIEIKTKNKEEKQNKSQNQPVLVIKRNSELKITKDSVSDSIHQIAQKRKNSIDFDLQIQGNKKSIRIKDCSTCKSPTRKKFQSLQLPQQDPQLNNREASQQLNVDFNFEPQNPSKTLKTNPNCTFFKRFKEQHYPKQYNENQKQSLLVSKIKYNLGKLNEISSPTDWNFQRSFTGEPRLSETPARLRRQIRSSWNSNHADQARYPKIVTAEHKRINIKRKQKQTRPNFTNDINGWNVKDQKEEDQLIFGN